MAVDGSLGGLVKRSHQQRRLAAVVALFAVVAAVAALNIVSAAAAVGGCAVRYTVGSQWAGGFTASIAITNLGDPVTSWNLTWAFTAGQQLTQGWNATYAQSGTQVSARSLSYNGSLATGASTTVGFNGSWTATNPSPTGFALNGVACNGIPTPSATSVSPTVSPTVVPTGGTGTLPGSFQWSSGGPIIGPKNDASHTLSAVKDPSVVFYNGRYHVFATVTSSTGAYSMVYLNFTDWSQAGSATHFFLDQTPIGSGYKAAPQIFYFAPQRLWYLVYQTGNDASYSTNADIGNPSGWTAPKGFYGGMPQIIRDNIGSGFWVDMWVACDSANCHLFSSDDNGHLYRSQTSVSSFPSGMSQPVITMQDSNKFNLFEAGNVYKVSGANQYLLIIEAATAGRRYFRSWTSTSLDGTWSPLAATPANPFAGNNTVTFTPSAWTTDVSHGEMIRSGYDQTLTISPCHLQYLYQGRDPSVDTGSYSTLPWRLALLTQTNSSC
jgi:hypothetical protein